MRCQDKITPPNQMSTSASVTFSVNAAGLPSGLVAKYSFVNGLATDTSGNNLGGVVQGATKVAGKYGDGLSLDGVNDYINFASPAQLDNLAPGSYTVWIKPSTNAGYVLSRRDAGCTGYWRLGFGTTGPHWLNQRGASATSTSVTPLNTWSHVAVTWDGTKTTTGTKIYVNGIDKTGTVTPLGSTASDAGCSFSAGARSASTEWFNGSLDEIRVYNRVLSPAEVQSDMNTP